MKKPRRMPEAISGLQDLFPLSVEVRAAVLNLLGDEAPLPSDILSLRKMLKEKMRSISDPEKADDLHRLLENTDILMKLSELYGYEPEPLTEETIPLKLDFSCLDNDLREVATKYDDLPESRIPQLQHTLPEESGENVQFIMSKTIKGSSPKDPEWFIMMLTHKNYARFPDPHKIGVNIFRRKSTEKQDTWDFSHRLVYRDYRNQGIGTEMLKKAELFFQCFANATGRTQKLSIVVRQADILIWALKNGLMPATTNDRQRILRLLQGDPDLMIVSGGGFEAWRRWYMFEKENYYNADGKPNPNLWVSLKCDLFLKKAFKVRLVKVFYPE